MQHFCHYSKIPEFPGKPDTSMKLSPVVVATPWSSAPAASCAWVSVVQQADGVHMKCDDHTEALDFRSLGLKVLYLQAKMLDAAAT